MFELVLFGIEFAALDWLQVDGDFFAIAQQDGWDLFANRQAGDQPHEIGHLFVVTDVGGGIGQAKNEVARAQVGSRGWRIVDDAANQHATLAVGMLEEWLDVDAEPASLNFASGDNGISDGVGQIARNCSAQSELNFINADDFTLQIDERTAGVAGVNGCVMANPAHERAHVFTVQAKAAKSAK